MAGIKIINILKDDEFQDILGLFRSAQATEVIFVLPKNGRVFRTEDHFAAFASEAANGNKTISILASNPKLTAWARKYSFNVMSSGKSAPAEKPTATLATQPPPMDPDILDESADAYQDDVVVPGGERDEIKGPDEGAEADPLHGMHIEDEDGPVDVAADKDDKTDEPTNADLTIGDDADLLAASMTPFVATLAMAKAKVEAPKAKAAPGTSAKADLDYIDTMWRKKAAEQAPAAPAAPAQSTYTPDGVAIPVRRGTDSDMDMYDSVPAAPATTRGFKGFMSDMGGNISSTSHRISKPIALGILLASAAVLGTIVYMTTGAAAVVVTPASQDLDTQVTVQVSDSFSSVDPSFGKMPGQLFEVTKTATHDGVATGQREVASKARGKITISNLLSSSPQPLIATTRFETPSGLVFRTMQSVTVPGSTVSGGKAVAGTVTVDVVADKPGSQYDIAPSTFVISAFKERGDTERATKITGASSTAFTGGANGPSKVVVQADYDAAKDAASTSVIDMIKAAFAQQASGMIILDEAMPTVSKVESTAQPDDAAATFTVTATGTLKTVAFRKADLVDLVAKTILAKERLAVVPEQLKLTYSDVAFKPDLGVLVFTVTVKGPGYKPLDAKAITSDIKGMNLNQVRDYFAKREDIHSATTSLSPFWVRSVPKDIGKIHLEIDQKAEAR